MKSGTLTLRKPIPLARAIRWVPAGLFTPPRTLDDLALFITQSALREVMRHLRSAPERELLGFLLGELYECPETGARYVVINSAFRTGYTIAESDRILIPEEEWLGVQLEVRRRRTQLVGWYHSAPFVGPHPAGADLETHRALFTEPWQCGMVIATSGDAPTGAFFRSLMGERTGGGVLVPFYELADEDEPMPVDGRKRTLIDWVNYETRGIVERDESERRPFVPTPPPTPRGTPVILSVPSAPDDAEDNEEDRIFAPPPAAAAPLAQPVRPAQPDPAPPQAPSPAVPQGAPSPMPEAAPPQAAPPEAAPALEPQPSTTAPTHPQPHPPAPPPVQPPAAPPAQPSRPSPARPSRTIIPLNPPTEESPFEPAAPAAPAVPAVPYSNGGNARRVGAAGVGNGGGGPRTPAGSRPGVSPLAGGGLVMLPSAAELQEMLAEPAEPAEDGGGLRTGTRFFLILATVAAVALIYLWNSGRLELPGFLAGLPVLDNTPAAAPRTTTADAAPEGTVPGTAPNPAAITPPIAESAGASLSFPDSTVAAPSESTSAGRQPASPTASVAAQPTSSSSTSTDPAVQHFAALADTLEESIRNFHDRNDDFGVRRITCDGLAVGYRAADDAFIALASARRSARESLDPAQESRYRELVRQMDQVNEEFEGSKCPRP